MFDRSGVLVSTLHGLIEKIVPRVIALRNQTGRQIDEQFQHHRQQQYWLGGQAYQPGGLHQQNRPEEIQRYQSKEDWADMIAKVTEEQFGVKLKDQTSVYRPPYPEWLSGLIGFRFQADIRLQTFSSFQGKMICLRWNISAGS